MPGAPIGSATRRQSGPTSTRPRHLKAKDDRCTPLDGRNAGRGAGLVRVNRHGPHRVIRSQQDCKGRHSAPMTRRATAHGTLAGAEAAVARRIALLGAVTQALSEEIAFDRVLERTLDAVMEVTGVSGGGIFLVDEGATDLRLVIHRGISEALANSFVINPSQTVRRLATDPSATLIVSNYDDIENRRPEVAADGIRGYAAIPLQARGRSLGVLIVCNTSHSDFAAADVDLLVSIGKQIGLA